MAKYDIFISYNRKDIAVADKICSALDRAGFKFFIDRKGISRGMEFPLILADAICDSELFLFLASHNSYNSKFTNNEITFAFNEKPKQSILPYIIDGSELPRHMRFIFAGINWRNLEEHPIESVLISDIAQLLNRQIPSQYEPNNDISKRQVRIITPKHATLIGDLVNQINLLPKVLRGVLNAKRRYSAIIRIEAYKKIPNVGIAIIGTVLYGKIYANSNLFVGTHNQKGLRVKDVVFHNISDISRNPMYSDIVVQTMKGNSADVSDFDVYLDILSSIRYNERTPFASAEAGNIVGMHLSGITLKHIEGCTHIYKEFLPTNTNQNII